jgi:hypothetical protein
MAFPVPSGGGNEVDGEVQAGAVAGARVTGVDQRA